MKVLIVDKINPICKIKLLEKGFEVEEKYGLSKVQLKNELSDYDILIIRTITKIDKDVLEKAHELKIIACAAAGIDNIDTDATDEKNIKIISAPEAHTIAAAEHTFSLLLLLQKPLHVAIADIKLEKWKRDEFLGEELYGKKIGIVGVGRIGSEMVKRANAFGMEILGNDIIEYPDKFIQYKFKFTDYITVLRESDFITFHVPLTNLTENMFTYNEIRKCKKGVKLINTSRGRVINSKDVLRGLNEKIISRVALDVFENEPIKFPDELISHQNVIATPHIGAATAEAKEKVAKQISEKIISYFKI